MTRTVKVAAVLAALMAVLAGCRTMTGRSARKIPSVTVPLDGLVAVAVT